MRQRLIFYKGETQFRNTGDALINLVLIQCLRKKGRVIVDDKVMPEHYIQDLSLSDKERSGLGGLRFMGNIYRHAFRSFLRLDNTTVFLIAGPPGHLYGYSIRKAARTIFAALMLLPLRVMKVKIIKIGFSFGPVSSVFGYAEAFRASLINGYYVRDAISLSLSKTYGIKRAAFFPDLAWLYRGDILPSFSLENKVIFSFRKLPVDLQDPEAFLTRLYNNLLAISRSLNGDCPIEIVYQVDEDFMFCERLYNKLKQEIANVKFNPEIVTLENAAAVYSTAICIITDRLHGALLASKYNALPIILKPAQKHKKTTGIFEHAGIERLLLNIEDDIDANVDKLTSLLKDKDKWMAKIKLSTHDYEKYADQVFDEIFT